jgi:hypothetical protein
VSATGLARSSVFRLFNPGPERVVFLAGDQIFAQARDESPRLVGRLSDYIRALAREASPALGPCAGVIGEARSYAARRAELAFVLCELLPELRALGPRQSPAAPRPRGLPRRFREFEQRATTFLTALSSCDSRSPGSAILPEACAAVSQPLGLPCALMGKAAIPLEPIRRRQRCEVGVVLGTQPYRYRLNAARPLPSFLSELMRMAALGIHHAAMENPSLRRCASDLLKRVRSLLSSCGVNQPELRFPLAQGGRLTLQHRAGAWLVAYGPARARATGGEPFFVTLPVQGADRAARLTVLHRVSNEEDDAFLPNGEFKRGTLCVGEKRQYRILHAKLLSEAEAFLSWLNAGIVLATGRSAFHQQWRAQRAKKRGAPRRRVASAR